MHKLEFRIDTAFLHKGLALQILSPLNQSALTGHLNTIDNRPQDNITAATKNALFVSYILNLLKRDMVKSIETSLLKNEPLTSGMLAWIETDFNFKGVPAAERAKKTLGEVKYAEFNATLKRFNNLIIKGKFNIEHLLNDSAALRLSGRKRILIFGYIQEANDLSLVLRPIIIGDRILEKSTPFDIPFNDDLQVAIEEIDEFKKVKNVPYGKYPLALNKDIPENQIKSWIAEILFEDNVPKDWAGERSDLFTNHIHLYGHRYNAAFLLKGPSKFHRMTNKDLGKNGDQISRLFDEPAQIYILQHSHAISQDIIKTMKAFASQFHRISRYCIIDGYDTLRLWKAYNKI